jgi:hypothetical protein
MVDCHGVAREVRPATAVPLCAIVCAGRQPQAGQVQLACSALQVANCIRHHDTADGAEPPDFRLGDASTMGAAGGG